MRSRTLALLVLFFGATSLFLLGVVVAPLLGLIPPRALGSHPAATISLDLSGQVAELQAERLLLQAQLGNRTRDLATLEARLADIEPTGAVEGPAAKAATELDDLRARLADSEAVHARAVAQATAMQQAAAALRDERDAVRQELVAAQGAVAALRRDVATAEAARAEDAGSAAREIVDLRTALSVRDAEVARLQARVAAAEVAARTATAPVPEPGRETGQGSAPAPVSAVNPETGRDDSPDAIVSVTAAPRGNATVADGVLAYQGGDYDAAFAIWQPLAVQGNARAQFHLGALYFEGRGVVRDTVLARRWLGRAVEGGWAPAENLLTQLDTAAR